MTFNPDHFGYYLSGALFLAAAVVSLCRLFRRQPGNRRDVEPPLLMLGPQDPLTLHQAYEGL